MFIQIPRETMPLLVNNLHQMFETIVVLTYVYSEHSTGKAFYGLVIYHIIYNANSLKIPLNYYKFCSCCLR